MEWMESFAFYGSDTSAQTRTAGDAALDGNNKAMAMDISSPSAFV
jgi:hypothetical protein